MLLLTIDQLLIEQRVHAHLQATDDCYYLREYTSGRDWRFSDTNQLISNLKKDMTLVGTAEWPYKQRAINQVAIEIAQNVNPRWLTHAAWVPMPPSRLRGTPTYDDRLVKVLKIIAPRLDIRDIIELNTELDASHTTQARPTPHDLRQIMTLTDAGRHSQAPERFIIFDDVLTAGAHFKAAQGLLADHFPKVPITGMFVSRRVFAPP
jgi:hypothetical protein